MSQYWYTIRTKPRKEKLAKEQIILRGLQAYLPMLRVYPVNPRSRKYVPYFPGYLFIYADLDVVGSSALEWIPHTIGIVKFGGEPAIVPEKLIDAIEKKLKQINNEGEKKHSQFQHGDKITIKDGPFRDYEAIFDAQISGKERVKVLLKLLGDRRQIPIELNVNQIMKK